MSSKIKKLKDLERKLTVSVPVEDYQKKYGGKLSKIKSTAKLDGFRKGNVPDDVLKQRYGDSIHYEVLNELIQESYPKELQEQDLKPASSPAIKRFVLLLIDPFIVPPASLTIDSTSFLVISGIVPVITIDKSSNAFGFI